MVSNLHSYRLEDCMDAIIDYRGKTPKKTDSGIPLITAKIIKNGRIQEVNEFIAEGDYDSWMRRGIPKAGDIVLTTEAPLGEVAQLDDRRIALAQRVITLRGKKGLLNNDYLKYLLQSNDIQHQLDGRGTGTTVKGIKQSELREVILKFPDLPVQESVAFILKTLDGKIENNRRTNQTLELMAQTLFKSWFVDFDPVIDNALAAGNLIPVELQERAELRKRVIAERTTTPKLKPLPDDIQQLFPSKFEHCGNNSMGIAGWIPVGWRVDKFPAGTEFREGPGILAKDFYKEGVPLIRLAGLKNGVSLLDGCNFLDPVKVDQKWSHFKLKEGDILLSSSASLGRVAEVNNSAVGTIAYTGIISFRPIIGITNRRFLRHFLQSNVFQNQVAMAGVGSVLNHFGPTHIKNMSILGRVDLCCT